MLSSLILSLAMSATPAPVIESDSLMVNETGQTQSSIHIGISKNKVRIGISKKSVSEYLKIKFVSEYLKIKFVSRSPIMINLFKTLFVTQTKANPIAANIEIKEMPASTWWK